MRLKRLDLIKYGNFTDKSVDFPEHKTDFHIVFGPNEAGKSTTLTAIEDLLFGIPNQSPYNFLHDYKDMCVGAVIENGKATLPVVRRKGAKNTLLGTNGDPISGGEQALASFLNGADRSFFERMFSLNHERLEQGGQEILQAKDDVGQMLFSAGAGVAGLRDQLNALLGEADTLWSRTRAQRRQYYQAHDRFKEADIDLRNQSLSVAKWRDLKNNFKKAEDTYCKVEEAFKGKSAEKNRLSRIRRVYYDVRRKQGLDAAIENLDDAVLLPEDALAVFEEAERNTRDKSTHIETLVGRLKQAQVDLDTLAHDETLILRADDIGRLHKRRIEIEGERADLPNRKAELVQKESELGELALDLGWKTEDAALLLERIPRRVKVSVVRELMNQRGELVSNVSNKTEELEEAIDNLSIMETELGDIGEPTDSRKLAVIIRSVREEGDIAGRVRNTEKECRAAQRQVDRLLATLKPSVSTVEDVEKMDVPAIDIVSRYSDRVQAQQESVDKIRLQIKDVERSLAKSIQTRKLKVIKGVADTPEALEKARERRNALWHLVKLKYIDKNSIPTEKSTAFSDDLDDLAGAFEPAIEWADRLADDRFINAEAIALITEISRTIDERQEHLNRLKKEHRSLQKETKQLKDAWTAMWAKAPLEPLEPKAMMTWLKTRAEILEGVEKSENALRDRDIERAHQTDAKQRLISELAAVEVNTSSLEDKTLSECLVFAEDEQAKFLSQERKREQKAKDITDRKNDVMRRTQQLDEAKMVRAAWQENWFEAIGEVGLKYDLIPEAVNAQIEVIESMLQTKDRIDDLRHNRIDKINRDITEFERAVSGFVEQNAKDLTDRSPEEAVKQIEIRLSDAQSLRGLQNSKRKDIDDLNKNILVAEEERRKAAVSINRLKETAGVESNEVLKKAIEISNELRAQQKDRGALVKKLEKDGDGFSVKDLEKECLGVDIDQITAQETSINAELPNYSKLLHDASAEKTTAQQAFEAFGGDGGAAKASSARQDALSEIRSVSERYVRVRTSALILQWAIDRYRQEKQAPLLKRAGELFTRITAESFTELRVVYDEQDQPKLTGLRPDESVVSVSGMSDGTADQLYLALRAASIEDYSERADVLPFVADDLFINFDDNRAAAGFEVLEQLSEKTQVLFFTHHQHLVDIAIETLGESVSVVSLSENRLGTGT